METLSEHIVPIMILLGVVFSALVGVIGFTTNYIIEGLKTEMRNDREQRERAMADFAKKVDKIEGYLENITKELYDRMRKAEESLGKIWSEHRVIKEMGTCHLLKQHVGEDEG